MKLLNKGEKFGKLTIIERDTKINKNEIYWLCKCDCGNLKSTAGSALRLKRTIRCNNCKSKATVEKNLKHNHANRNNKTPTYISWASMMTRCYNENRKQYLDYGGRGIKVHNKWHEFINFLKDMGERPNGTTIDRINVNGNYEPNNCRWSDRKVQNNNKRNKKWW